MIPLKIDRVTKRYGSKVAVNEIDIEVRPGEIYGLLGANGAGKTTTMRMALGLILPDEGSIYWKGKGYSDEVRRWIGYLPEERGLYPRMTVADQLVYLARLHGLSPADARGSVDAWIERLGVSARRDDEVLKLSLGNQQRVQLAAALVHDPDVLILDEPFSGLDPVAVDVMSDVLRQKCADGVPVVFSSHQLDLVERLCDRIGIIREGRMVAVGAVDELRAGAPTRIEVHAPAAPDGWADALPGVTTLQRRDGRTLVELGDGTDDQQLLAAALATGPVHEFARRPPSLAELFRHAVSEETTG